MSAKLIIRVSPEDRIEVRVEGLTELDKPKPQGEKLCEKITERLEQDLGWVEQREYLGDNRQEIRLVEEDRLLLGNG